MFHQYEQQCNALAAEKMGVTVIWSEKEFDQKLNHWLKMQNPFKSIFLMKQKKSLKTSSKNTAKFF